MSKAALSVMCVLLVGAATACGDGTEPVEPQAPKPLVQDTVADDTDADAQPTATPTATPTVTAAPPAVTPVVTQEPKLTVQVTWCRGSNQFRTEPAGRLTPATCTLTTAASGDPAVTLVSTSFQLPASAAEREFADLPCKARESAANVRVCHLGGFSDDSMNYVVSPPVMEYTLEQPTVTLHEATWQLSCSIGFGVNNCGMR